MLAGLDMGIVRQGLDGGETDPRKGGGFNVGKGGAGSDRQTRWQPATAASSPPMTYRAVGYGPRLSMICLHPY